MAPGHSTVSGTAAGPSPLADVIGRPLIQGVAERTRRFVEAVRAAASACTPLPRVLVEMVVAYVGECPRRAARCVVRETSVALRLFDDHERSGYVDVLMGKDDYSATSGAAEDMRESCAAISADGRYFWCIWQDCEAVANASHALYRVDLARCRRATEAEWAANDATYRRANPAAAHLADPVNAARELWIAPGRELWPLPLSVGLERSYTTFSRLIAGGTEEAPWLACLVGDPRGSLVYVGGDALRHCAAPPELAGELDGHHLDKQRVDPRQWLKSSHIPDSHHRSQCDIVALTSPYPALTSTANYLCTQETHPFYCTEPSLVHEPASSSSSAVESNSTLLPAPEVPVCPLRPWRGSLRVPNGLLAAGLPPNVTRQLAIYDSDACAEIARPGRCVIAIPNACGLRYAARILSTAECASDEAPGSTVLQVEFTATAGVYTLGY